MTEKKKEQTTPIGAAKWAHVQEPKAAFDDKGEPKYMIDVCFDAADPAWKEWAGAVMAKVRSEKLKVSPIKEEKNEADEPTGRYFVTFKTGAKYKPDVCDKYGKPFTGLIGNGSKVRIAYIENQYKGFGGGLNFYLNAIQVLELVEYQARSAKSHGFEVEAEPEMAKDESEQLPF